MEKILFHLKAQQRFAELGITVSAISVVPVRFHLHTHTGKLLAQFLAWEGEKENGIKYYISFKGLKIDRYSREYKDYQVSKLNKGDTFFLLDGEGITFVIDNKYLRAFDFCKPSGEVFFEIERRHI